MREESCVQYSHKQKAPEKWRIVHFVIEIINMLSGAEEIWQRTKSKQSDQLIPHFPQNRIPPKNVHRIFSLFQVPKILFAFMDTTSPLRRTEE